MTSSKNTKRALLASVLSVVLCCAMLIGSTFAWFTDSVTNTGNRIQAGNLEIDLLMDKEGTGNYTSIAGGKGDIFGEAGMAQNSNETLWEPGKTQIVYLGVQNRGNLALKYNILLDVTDNGLAGALEYAVLDGAKAEDLAGVKDWETLKAMEGAQTGDIAAGRTTAAPNGCLDEIVNGTKDETDYFALAVHMKKDAGNEYQGKDITIDVTVVATQATAEEDGFGNDQYDANAHPDAVFGASILENLKNADVTEVVAGENIDMSDSTFQTNNYGNAQFDIPDGKTLDLNNNSIVRPDGGSGNGFKFSNGVTSTVTNGYVINEGDSTAIDIEYGANATFEKVTFIGHGDGMVRVRASGEVEKTTAVFKNCTFENAGVVIQGMNDATNVDIQFIDCEFTGSYYMYDENGNRLTDRHGNVHSTTSLIDAESNYLYGNISFDNCTFEYDATEARSTQNVIELYGCNYPGNILKVTLNDVTINAKKANPVSTDSRYEDGLNLVKTGTNNFTKDGAPVDCKGNSLS